MCLPWRGCDILPGQGRNHPVVCGAEGGGREREDVPQSACDITVRPPFYPAGVRGEGVHAPCR